MKNKLIEQYGMTLHPEGGAFVESYRSSVKVLAEGRTEARVASTAIYFLLGAGEFSAFHRIRSDEVWHFYQGGPIRILEIDSAGFLKETLLGADPSKGEVFQHVVPAGVWFASAPIEGTDYALVGCTVAPGFEF
ncbi:MAG: cupin domain-containing protein, partial [Proteobacteria bacterium]